MRPERRLEMTLPGSGQQRPHGYPLRLKLTFATSELSSCPGQSETVEISSRELSFDTNERFTIGQCLWVSVEWPARLDGRLPLRMTILGRVLQTDAGRTTVSIDSHEFRIRRIEAAPRFVAGRETLYGGSHVNALSA